MNLSRIIDAHTSPDPLDRRQFVLKAEYFFTRKRYLDAEDAYLSTKEAVQDTAE